MLTLMLYFSNNMLTLKKFTKMRDDEMMIRISVKIARMYVNDFNTPKDNCLNSGT